MQNQHNQMQAAEAALLKAIVAVQDAQNASYQSPAGVEVDLMVEKAGRRLVEALGALRKTKRQMPEEVS